MTDLANMTTLINRAAGKGLEVDGGRGAQSEISKSSDFQSCLLPTSHTTFRVHSEDPSRPSPAGTFCSDPSLSLKADPSHASLSLRDSGIFTDRAICPGTGNLQSDTVERDEEERGPKLGVLDSSLT